MKRSLLVAAAAAAAAAGPSAAAYAALTLRVDTIMLPGPPAGPFSGAIEIFFQETAPLANEQLQGYNIRAVLNNNGTGVAFTPPAVSPTAHPWVLPAGSSALDFTSTATVLQFGADATAAQNVDNNEGVVRIGIQIPAGTPAGNYPITIDTSNGATTFANAAGTEIAFSIQNGGITIGAPYLVADANGDGQVDVADLGIVATNFNDTPPNPAGRPGGDFNNDGTVNVADLGILATFFNQPNLVASDAAVSWQQALAAYPALQSAIPEPSVAGLLTLAGGLLTLRRRRASR
jgi:hypothetical protein